MKHLAYLNKKNNSKQRGITFELTYEGWLQLISQTHCYYTGIKFEPTINNKVKAKTLTLDRIDNTLGYIPGNVVACCHFVNAFKNEVFEQQEKKLREYNLVSRNDLYSMIYRKLYPEKQVVKKSKFKQILEILMK